RYSSWRSREERRGVPGGKQHQRSLQKRRLAKREAWKTPGLFYGDRTVQIRGIPETAPSVPDPAVSAGFYKRLFGFDTLLDTDRLVALSVAGRDVLLLFRKGATEEPVTLPEGVIPGHGTSGRSHLAFSIPAEDLKPWQERLAGEGVAVESTVSW